MLPALYRALARHDSEPCLEAAGALLVTGPTGTNVADWAFAIRGLIPKGSDPSPWDN
ncbi:MAG: hypothetical protein M3542_12210 [Acidobacteriota bacterium]|nr:hypothetical protein [Acidobacteriota bacterium]MDQ5870621.1 hypothetical protein [Acidobacteriota bacterium]